jgi:hypothetical protein
LIAGWDVFCSGRTGGHRHDRGEIRRQLRVNALIPLLRRVHQHKGEVTVAGLRSSVKMIFDITGVAKMFRIANRSKSPSNA